MNEKLNRTVNYIIGFMAMIVSALFYISAESYVEGIGLTMLTAITLIAFVVGGGIIWMTLKTPTSPNTDYTGTLRSSPNRKYP